MDKKVCYYNDYYTLEEIGTMYKKLDKEQKKEFRDTLSHYILLEILKKCNYDEKIIESIDDLAETETAIINMHGSDCGTPILALKRMYKRNLRKLINLIGKLAKDDDRRMNIFINGEWFLNNLICLTIGSSFDKDIIDDCFIIDYNSLTEDECLAISNNFVRYMNGEEIVFYNGPRKSK